MDRVKVLTGIQVPRTIGRHIPEADMDQERDRLTRQDLIGRPPREVREAIRSGAFTGTSHRLGHGFVHCNLAIVPRDYAFDMLLFCQRNPKPCPLVEVLDPGDPEPRRWAPGGDISTDLSRYAIYRDGALVEEVPSLRGIWRDDHVGFLMGCSISFDVLMTEAGIPLRHLETEGGRISVYKSTIPCAPAGRLAGNVVVSMRPIKRRHLVRAIEVTAAAPIAHGAPVHVGDPRDIGIDDLDRVDWGLPNPLRDDEVPVFWACGVTPQLVAMQSGIPEMITHSTGHMFISDMPVPRPAPSAAQG
jgi:uncharacterized protein YcsI (UPF0317 family)